MSAWITLTDADVRLSAAERAKIDALKPADVDLASIVTSAAGLARSYIGARYQLAETPQVPPEVKDAVLAIALANYLALIPGHKLLDDARSAARDNAIAYLKDVGAGKASVSPPDTPVAQAQPGGLIETAQEGNAGNSREELAGL